MAEATASKQATKPTPRRFQGCLIKTFPRTFQYGGERYVIAEDQKKYLNNQLNVIFLEGYPHPLALDRLGNNLPLRNRKVQATFSAALKQMGANERSQRTLKRSSQADAASE